MNNAIAAANESRGDDSNHSFAQYAAGLRHGTLSRLIN